MSVTARVVYQSEGLSGRPTAADSRIDPEAYENSQEEQQQQNKRVAP